VETTPARAPETPRRAIVAADSPASDTRHPLRRTLLLFRVISTFRYQLRKRDFEAARDRSRPRSGKPFDNGHRFRLHPATSHLYSDSNFRGPPAPPTLSMHTTHSATRTSDSDYVRVCDAFASFIEGTNRRESVRKKRGIPSFDDILAITSP